MGKKIYEKEKLMLYLFKNGKKIENSKSENLLEILEIIQEYTELECDFFRGETGIKQIENEYKYIFGDIKNIFQFFNLKESDFYQGEVFVINCYKNKLNYDVKNTKAFVFKEKNNIKYKEILEPFFGDELMIVEFEE